MALLMRLEPRWGRVAGWAPWALLAEAATHAHFSMVASRNQVQDSQRNCSKRQGVEVASLLRPEPGNGPSTTSALFIAQSDHRTCLHLSGQRPCLLTGGVSKNLWPSLIHRQSLVVGKELCYFKYGGWGRLFLKGAFFIP